MATQTTSRTPTTKGLEYRVGQLAKQKKSVLSKYIKKYQEVQECLEKDPNMGLVAETQEELKSMFDSISSIYKEQVNLLQDQEELETEHRWFKGFCEEHQTLVKQFDVLKKPASPKDVEESASKCGSKLSITSSVKLRRAESAAKRAALEAEAKFKEKERSLALSMKKLQDESDRLVDQKKIAIAAAEEEAFAKFDEEDDEPLPDLELPDAPQHYYPVHAWIAGDKQLIVKDSPNELNNENVVNDSLDPQPATRRQSFDKVSDASALEAKVTSVLDTLVDIQRRSRVPLEELEVFSGDVTEFPEWLRNFEDLIERNIFKAGARLRLLGKHLKGDAKRCVRGLLSLNTMTAYKQAKQSLSDWFGNSFEIAQAFKKKLEQWPIIATNDGGTSLRDFAYYLDQVKAISLDSEYKFSLDEESLNQLLALKLPKGVRDRWSRKVLDTREKNKPFPAFKDFCDHVRYEAKLACMPGLGTAVLDRTINERRSASKSKGYRKTTVHTVVNVSASSTKKLCLACQEETDHDLEECKDLKKMKYTDKVEFIKRNNICFGCLKPGHRSKDCLNRKTCKSCQGNHATTLHRNAPQVTSTVRLIAPRPIMVDKAVTTNYATCSDEVRSTRIIPVTVCAEQRNIDTYAILDEQSDSSFISEDLQEQLSLKGDPVKLKLSTITSTNNIDTMKILDLKVCNYLDSTKSVVIKDCYTRNYIPVNREQILRKTSLKKIPGMKQIMNEIPDFKEDLEVGMLIGTNCLPALEPMSVIYDPKFHCYAIKSRLGWSCVGVPNSYLYNEEVTCHKSCVIVQDNFIRTKEITPANILKNLMQDFVDINVPSNVKDYSIEDRRFLKICRENIKQLPDGHMQLPLPFKRDGTSLPSNKAIAYKRLNSIEKRFNQNEEFKNEYNEFMNMMIKMGYAEKVPSNEIVESGKEWFLPHHGVQHPSKKLRVVFDASSKYEDVSLNCTLLPGPDLTNNLLGVLLRFRTGKIAAMCDIEKMFLQVRVKEEHRNFLKFLWWENGNVDNEPLEYRMCSHLFGAVSSPSCANFALRYTADKYKDHYGESAAKFIKDSFYVDDGLLSTNSVEDAVTTIRSSKGLCAAGGLKLTKFVSNNKEVLRQLENEDLASSLTLIDLSKDQLPDNKALGLQWNVEEDKFVFKGLIKDRPLTRRGIMSSVASIFDPLGFVSCVVLEGKRILQQLCKKNADWDSPVPEDIKSRYEKWQASMNLLENIKIPRCYVPMNFCGTKIELHNFSDASLHDGYGQCSFLRFVNEERNCHCTLVMSKSRVVPLKSVTVPRLELTAAVMSAKIGNSISKELKIPELKTYYWCDSKVVLGYITNEEKRFHIYVSNRIQEIRNLTSPTQWFYIDTDNNPADLCSRE